MISKILQILGLHSASNFKRFSRSLEHFFFLTVGQNNFGNKIPLHTQKKYLHMKYKYVRYLWTLPFILTTEFGSWPEIIINSLTNRHSYLNMVKHSRPNIIIFHYIMFLTCDVVQDWPSTRLRSESKEERSPLLFWVCGTLFLKKEKKKSAKSLFFPFRCQTKVYVPKPAL